MIKAFEGWRLFATVALCGALWGGACASDSDGGAPAEADAGSAGDGAGGSGPANAGGASGHAGDEQALAGTSGRDNDGGAPPLCYVEVAGAPAALEAADDGPRYPTFAWSGDGLVGVAPGPEGQGYNVFQLTVNGTLAHPAQILWPEEQPMEGVHLAVSGDVLAMVDLALDVETGRPYCRLALARLGDPTAVYPPTRFSDPPDPDSILNEALACDVTALDDGFLVVWHQFVSSTSDASAFFAQAFDREGGEVGDRLTLNTSNELAGEFSVTSDGTRAVAVLQTARSGQSELVFIEGGELRSTALDTRVGGFATLAPAHDGFIARNGGTFSVLDPEGRLVAGPIELATSTQLAPLDDGYVFVANEEYLIARTLTADLGAPSAPTTISDNRLARSLQLVSAPDGSHTVLLYVDDHQLHVARLACSDTMPPPLGPPACPEQSAVTPLDDGCSDPVCHVLVRLDYLTLGLRGWAVTGGAASPVAGDAATDAARAVFSEHGDYPDITLSGPEAGLFTANVSPLDFGAFALVGEESGLVVAAGGIVWSGTGQYWVPAQWSDPGDLACGPSAVEPEATYLDPSRCDSDEEPASTTVEGALDVVLRSNLAAHVASQGPFSAHAYLYTPSVGACSPQNAEYLVVLTRVQ